MPRGLQSVLDAYLDGVILLDRDGRVERVNIEACRILDGSSEHLEKSAVEELLGDGHRLAVLARQVLHSGRPVVENDVLVEHRYDQDLQVDLAVSPLDDPDGALVVMRDRTIQDSLRELDSQREQLDSYGHIAAGIAHEVKNPLGGIRGAAELLESRASDERQQRTAALIVREVDRITALVDELMVFARGDTLRIEPLNIHRVLDSVLEVIGMDAASEQCGIERIYDPSIPDVEADADRLTQVFLNLLRNAVQSMDERGGTLTVATRIALDQRLTDAEGHGIPTLVIAVSDTGPGIPVEILNQLATPFFTTRPNGTGLGLAVSRHWVTRHGGTLRIASQPGEGTTVRVALPLSQSNNPERSPQ